MAIIEQHDVRHDVQHDVDELRERSAQLGRDERDILAEIARLGAEVERVRASRVQVTRDLEGAARVDMNLRSLDSLKVTHTRRRRPVRHVSDETLRDVVVALASFTEGGLAKMLGCSAAQAKGQLTRVAHMIEEVGERDGETVYAYRVPTDAGAAFSAQRLRIVPDEHVADLAQAGDGQAAADLLGSIRDKEVRKVVAAAIRDGGWTLTVEGGPHPLKLTRGSERIPLAANSAHAAKAIRRQLRNAS